MMPRKFFKKLFGEHSGQRVTLFGSLTQETWLWLFSRRSIARAFAVGLFCAFVPIPGQMLLAAGLAIIFRANFPISVALVWVTNPITIPAMFFSAYKLGTWILGTQLEPFAFEFTLNWLFTELQDRWQPFLTGCFAAGALASLIGYFSVHIYWRLYIFTTRRRRRKIRQ